VGANIFKGKKGLGVPLGKKTGEKAEDDIIKNSCFFKNPREVTVWKEQDKTTVKLRVIRINSIHLYYLLNRQESLWSDDLIPREAEIRGGKG